MLNGLKSDITLPKIFDYLQEKPFLEIIRYNKMLQKRTKKSINDYKAFHNIKIELIPIDNFHVGDIFINFIAERSFFHIHFGNNYEEIKLNYFTKSEKISKIKITLDPDIKTLRGLFKGCKCLKEIYFTKFENKNITNLGEMFQGCTSLIKLDISKLKTDNVTKMDWLFYKCESLLELNVSNFNTEKVTDMSTMFKHCFKIKELDLSNFNTSNVIDMKGMFYKCMSLEKLDLSNFNTSNVQDMKWMFDGCSSLMYLNILNFDTSKVLDMRWMFEGCSPLINIDISRPLFNGDFDFESASLFLKN